MAAHKTTPWGRLQVRFGGTALAMTESRTIDRDDRNDVRRANPLGAYVATLGALVFLISIWLDWVSFGSGDEETNKASGYEGDGVIPLMAYLGVGFALALLYATKRADRRQHRGLSLASFAVGLASLLWTVSFLIDAISTAQYQENVASSIGPWIALIGTLLWTVGSFLLAKEPEGDREDEHHTVASRPVPTTQHTDTRDVEPDVRRTAGHDVHHTTGHDVHHSTGATDVTGDGRNVGGSGTSGYRP